MALAEALHHSAGPSKKKVVERRERQEEAGSETYCAPRGPKTLPPGVRPAPLAEVAGPQVMAATGGYVAARAPLLAVSSLRGADGVDDTAVKYLLRAELKKKKEEEERKQVLADEALDEKLDAEMDALMAIGPERLTSRQQARLSAVLRERAELVERRKKRRTMRKRKKRSKRKLPKSSSGVRVRRCGQGSRSRSSSSCGCGRLCEHVRHVPAVADLQWKVLPSISSTKWWTFQLCYGDRYGCLQVQFLDNVVFLPGIVQRLALLVLTVQIFALVPQLQFIDGRRHPCFCAVAVTYGPACSENL